MRRPTAARRFGWTLGLLTGALLVVLLVAPLAAQEYTIGPRDVLKVVIWGHDDLSKEYVVDPDGFVPFPLVGRVKAAGLTPTAFGAQLRDLLEKDYLVNPQVLVSVKEYKSKKVAVLGEVRTPGTFPLEKSITALEAVTLAGGFTDRAALSTVRIVRQMPDNKQETLSLDLSGAVPKDRDVRVYDGDTILVSKGNSFFVFGEVRKPGAYQLEREMNILEGITLAGGFTDKAAPGRTRVIRSTPNGQEVLSVDMNDIIKRGQRDRAILLRENDVVVVPESFF